MAKCLNKVISKNDNIKTNPPNDNMGTKSSKLNKSEAKTSEIVYSDGTYVGEIHSSLPHGLGKYYYNNGELYIGNFEQGNCSGYGSHYDTVGQLVYCGEWRDNTYHGVGSYYDDNGKLWYWGEWKLGEAKGHGLLYDQYGTPTECYTPQPSPPEYNAYPITPTAPPMNLLYPNKDDICININ